MEIDPCICPEQDRVRKWRGFGIAHVLLGDDMKKAGEYISEGTKGSFEQLLLFIRTFRDIRLSQAVARARLIAKRIIRRSLRIKVKDYVPSNIEILPVSLVSAHIFREGFLERANDALKGKYKFLSIEVQFNNGIDWRYSSQSQLWRYHLNYCSVTMDFARAFHVTHDRKYLDALCNHIQSWIEANAFMIGDPWSPYCASLRIVNWILSCSAVWDEFLSDKPFQEMLLCSVLNHLNFIRSNLEYDVRCNHLLENIKALIVGGVFLNVEGLGSSYFKLGQRLLLQQLDEQILSDGGHCERSTMYHCIVLEDLLLIYEAYQCADIPVPSQLEDSIHRMIRFLYGMRMPSGQIPFLNDSVEDGALQPLALIEWADRVLGEIGFQPQRTLHFPESGYMRAETPSGDVLLFDCGEPCPKYQPGHAHADTLSIIWALADGTEILIDPGVYEYVEGPWRSYFRGTAAHNTIQIDGEDSTEVWKSFRAARKARIICSSLRRLGNATHLLAQHDGYTRLSGRPIHQRDVYLFDDGTLMVLDTLLGSGHHVVESRQHFHPDCAVSPCSNTEYVVSRKEHSIQLRFLTEGEVSLYKGSSDPILGWYAPSFGRKTPCPCVVWSNTVALPYRTGFVLHDGSSVPFQVNDDNISLSFECLETDHRIRLGQL